MRSPIEHRGKAMVGMRVKGLSAVLGLLMAFIAYGRMVLKPIV